MASLWCAQGEGEVKILGRLARHWAGDVDSDTHGARALSSGAAVSLAHAEMRPLRTPASLPRCLRRGPHVSPRGC